MPEPISWPKTLLAVQAGEESAAAELYSAVCTTLRRRMVFSIGADEAEDATHSVFIKVLLAVRRGDIRDPEHMWGIIAQAGRRQIADIFRYRSRHPERVNAKLAASPEEGQSSRGGGRAHQRQHSDRWGGVDRRTPELIAIQRESLSRALAVMTPRQREVTTEEEESAAAGRLGISVNAVSILRSRGRRRARLAIAA